MATLLSLLFVSPSEGQQPDQPRFTIETISAQCQTGLPSAESEIRTEGSAVIITEVLQAPTPCFEVQGEVKIEDGKIMVRLYAEERQGICIQCFAELTGRVTISSLPSGEYSLELETPRRRTVIPLKIGE